MLYILIGLNGSGKTKYAKTRPECIHLEHPTNSLHPKVHPKVLDDALSKSKTQDVLLETHSETIIDYGGVLVERKVITQKDICVLLFEDGEFSRKIEYDDEGCVNDWPHGFFFINNF